LMRTAEEASDSGTFTCATDAISDKKVGQIMSQDKRRDRQ